MELFFQKSHKRSFVAIAKYQKEPLAESVT